jgi:hypothetical protein
MDTPGGWDPFDFGWHLLARSWVDRRLEPNREYSLANKRLYLGTVRRTVGPLFAASGGNCEARGAWLRLTAYSGQIDGIQRSRASIRMRPNCGPTCFLRLTTRGEAGRTELD